MKQRERVEAKEGTQKWVHKRTREHNRKNSNKKRECKQFEQEERIANKEQRADELDNFFQQMLLMLSGWQESESEKLEEQIEKEVMEYKEQLVVET